MLFLGGGRSNQTGKIRIAVSLVRQAAGVVGYGHGSDKKMVSQSKRA